MKKETNPKILGAFVIGAIALLILTVITFGADQLFRERRTYVMFFDGSLNGLQEGAPVRFRGINIGRVTDIKVVLDHKTNQLFMPVYVEITPDSVSEVNIDRKTGKENHRILNELISQGLRGRLAMQSMVTGMLYVELDIEKNAPLNLSGRDRKYIEIPTIPSKTEELSNMLNTGQQALEQIRKFMKSPKLAGALENISSMMRSGKDAMVDIQGAATSGKKVMKDLGAHIDPLGNKAETVLHDFGDTLNSIRVLSDYLARHPEALIKGKAGTTRS